MRKTNKTNKTNTAKVTSINKNKMLDEFKSMKDVNISADDIHKLDNVVANDDDFHF